MISPIRILTRSGGLLAALVALAALAFYGIALLSVSLVDNPLRALEILAAFLALSGVFCLLLVWLFRRALAQLRRPIDSAARATTRLAAIGGHRGCGAIRLLGRTSAAAGGWTVAVFRTVRHGGGFLFRRRGKTGRGAPMDGQETEVSPGRDPAPKGQNDS